jgi:hypothetical protein
MFYFRIWLSIASVSPCGRALFTRNTLLWDRNGFAAQVWMENVPWKRLSLFSPF